MDFPFPILCAKDYGDADEYAKLPKFSPRM